MKILISMNSGDYLRSIEIPGLEDFEDDLDDSFEEDFFDDADDDQEEEPFVEE